MNFASEGRVCDGISEERKKRVDTHSTLQTDIWSPGPGLPEVI